MDLAGNTQGLLSPTASLFQTTLTYLKQNHWHFFFFPNLPKRKKAFRKISLTQTDKEFCLNQNPRLWLLPKERLTLVLATSMTASQVALHFWSEYGHSAGAWKLAGTSKRQRMCPFIFSKKCIQSMKLVICNHAPFPKMWLGKFWLSLTELLSMPY